MITSMSAPFGSVGAAAYDDDAVRMPKRYKQAHSIQNRLVVEALRCSAKITLPVVVDFGAGTANDGLEILSHSERGLYLGIDQSGPMIARAKEKMQIRGLASRSVFLERNFQTVTMLDVARVLHGLHANCYVAAVMSALALHHYELEDKRCVYTLACNLVRQGGLFVLTDLFSNGIADCARYALSKELGDIRAAVKRYGKRESVALRAATTLSVDHYKRSNKPQNLAHEIAILQESGFGRVDIVYRHGQLAVIVAERVE